MEDVTAGGGAYGSAEWMKTEKARSLGLLDGSGLRFGRSVTGECFRYGGDGHTLIVAPPGAGKGIGFVVPNLIFYEGSMIVIDPKGENAAQTAEYRRKHLGHEVFVLDPSGVSGIPSSSYNPLAWLEGSTKEDFIADVIEFSEAAVEDGFGKEAYWANCAQHLFRGLVLYLAGHEPEAMNLNRLYELSRRPLSYFLDFMRILKDSNCPEPNLREWVQEAGAWYLGQTSDHQKYHLGTMQQATTWMGNLGAQRIMGKSDFDFRDLKRKKMTVYLCIHPLQISAYRGWFRLLISQAIKGVFEPIGKPIASVGPSPLDIGLSVRNTSGVSPLSANPLRTTFGRSSNSAAWGFGAAADKVVEAPPVVFMLDEYARAVGRLSAVDNAIPQIRGYGGRFAFVLQSIGQAKDLYKEGWSAFEESCALQIFIQARGGTAEYVSERLGVKTQQTISGGGTSQTGRPLWFSNEVSSCPKDDVIALVEGQSPLHIKRLTSYSDPEIAPHLQQNNMERRATDARPRSLMADAKAARIKPGAETVEVAPEFDPTLSASDGGGDPVGKETEAVLDALSRHYGKKIIRRGGEIGYINEQGSFEKIQDEI